MHSNLVGAARDRPGFEEGEAIVGGEELEGGFGGLAAARIDFHALGGIALLADRLGAGPRRALWHTADDREISLLHAPGFEEFAVGLHGALGLAEEQDAGGFCIQAVNVTEESQIA